MGRLSLLVVFLLVSSGSTAAAQDSTSTLPQAIATLHLHQRIRLETLGGERFFGRYLAAGCDSITVRSPIAPGWRTVRVDTVAHAWVQDGTNALRGGAIGVPLGAVVLGYLWYGFCQALSEGTSCSFPAAALAGGLVGYVLGLVVGFFIPHWQPLYP